MTKMSARSLLHTFVGFHLVCECECCYTFNFSILELESPLQAKNRICPQYIPRIDLFQTSLSYSGSVLYNQIPVTFKHMFCKKAFKKNVQRFVTENTLHYKIENFKS